MKQAPMNAEERLKALEELELRQQSSQRRVLRAVWSSVVVAALVLAALIGSAILELRAVERQKAALAQDIDALMKQKKAAEQARDAAEQQRAAAVDALGDVPERERKAAIDRQFERAPRTAALLPRIYMQTVNAADLPRANAIRQALQTDGFLVLGIENVPGANGLKNTDVRFYHAAEKDEAARIAQALQKAGEKTVNLNYLKQFENSTRARPNHFEVWLANGGGAN
jgi:hypothetical protein